MVRQMTEEQIRDEIKNVMDEWNHARVRWESNPLHWTNNKRKMHGLCTLRGVANNKDRFALPGHIEFKYKKRLFEIVGSVTKVVLKAKLDNMLDNLVSIRECQYGEETNYREETNSSRKTFDQSANGIPR